MSSAGRRSSKSNTPYAQLRNRNIRKSNYFLLIVNMFSEEDGLDLKYVDNIFLKQNLIMFHFGAPEW